ncbi:MAG: type II toxin-antitoxin system VapC family toxin [Xanthobacteraceae bacterium]
MTFLLDTNVISEVRRKRPDGSVLSWLSRADPAALCISVLTLGEIAKGAAQCAVRDSAQAAIYYQWLSLVRSNYADRTIAVDADIAEAWGRLATKRTFPVVDGLIAATALVRGMTLVTHNVRDFADAGVSVIDPWSL